MKSATRRRRAAGAVLTVLASLVVPVVVATPAHATFTECPPIGVDTGCGALITVYAGTPPTAVVSFDPAQPPFDGDDDTLVGILNYSGAASLSIAISAPGVPLFSFDGDGLCTASGAPAGCPFGPTGYEGPGTGFRDYCAPSCTSGTVDATFTGSLPAPTCLPPGASPPTSTYFSLEGQIPSSVTVTVTSSAPPAVLTPHAEAWGIQGVTPAPISHAGPVTPVATVNDYLTTNTVGPLTVETVRVQASAPSATRANATAYVARVSVVAGADVFTVTGIEADAKVECSNDPPAFTGGPYTIDVSRNGISQRRVSTPETVQLGAACGPSGGVLMLNDLRPFPGGRENTAVRVVCPALGLDVAIARVRVWVT